MARNLLILLFFASSVMGAQVTIDEESDMPYSASSYDTITFTEGATFVLSQGEVTPTLVDLSYNPDVYAWAIAGSGVTGVHVFLNGATIWVDSGGYSNDAQCAIALTSGYTSGGNFIHGPGTVKRQVADSPVGDTAGGVNNYAVVVDRWNDSTEFRGFTASVDGHDGTVFKVFYPGPGSKFVDLDLYCYSTSFTDRQYFTSGGLHVSKLNANAIADSGNYQVHIDSVRVHASPHFGIAAYDMCVEMAYCSAYVDAQNSINFDACYPGECEGYNTWANCYALVANLIKPGTRIHHNKVVAGSDNFGCRGLLFESNVGTENYWLTVDSNEFKVHAGPSGDSDEPQGVVRGIRMRGLDGNSMGWIHILGNVIEGWTDTDTSTHHIGTEADLLQFGLLSTDEADGCHLIIENNQLLCRSMDATGTRCACGSYAPSTEDFDSGPDSLANLVIRYNKYQTSDWGVYVGDEANGFNGSYFTMVGDTFGPLPGGDTGTVSAYSALYVGGRTSGSIWDQSDSVVLLDPVFLGTAEDSLVTFKGDSLSSSDSGEVYFMATFTDTIYGGRNGAPAVNIPCSVFVTPGNDTNLIFVDTTDSTGVISGVVPYKYLCNGSHPTGSDTTDYNDIYVKAYRYNDTVGSGFTLDWDTKHEQDTIAEISGTVGAVSIPITGIFIHYSVGGGIWSFPGNECLATRLDTTTLIVDDDTVDFQIRDYQSNFDVAGNPMGDLACGEYTSNADYNLRDPSYARIRIKYGDDGSVVGGSDILLHMFEVMDASTVTDSPFYDLYQTHQITTDSLIEGGYDIVCIKNPYGCWYYPTQEMIDSIKVWYDRLRDSVALGHPGINFLACFGTPTIIGDASTGIDDSVESKMNYDLAAWFASSQFHTNLDTGAYKNFRTSEFYRAITEVDEKADRYFLDSQYWDNGAGHLNATGYAILQDSLYQDFIRAATSLVIQMGAGAAGPEPPQPAISQKKFKGFSVKGVRIK